jgi:NAD(P)-dependent dehydrogenase (short-subunit alcohol dehydrogenase family)
MLLGKTIVITGISSGIGARVGELARALGADIIGVDINEPTRPLDAFIRADIGSPQGVAEIVQTLPQRLGALCNVAGVSGMIGAARTLAINFLRVGSLAPHGEGRGGKGKPQCRLRLAANLERAKAFVTRQGFPTSPSFS